MTSPIDTYLKSCCELSRFCSSNGWIENKSLRYAISRENDEQVLVDIAFNELLMEDAGSLTDRIPCSGKMRLYLNRHGRVIRAEIL